MSQRYILASHTNGTLLREAHLTPFSAYNSAVQFQKHYVVELTCILRVHTCKEIELLTFAAREIELILTWKDIKRSTSISEGGKGKSTRFLRTLPHHGTPGRTSWLSAPASGSCEVHGCSTFCMRCRSSSFSSSSLLLCSFKSVFSSISWMHQDNS